MREYFILIGVKMMGKLGGGAMWQEFCVSLPCKHNITLILGRILWGHVTCEHKFLLIPKCPICGEHLPIRLCTVKFSTCNYDFRVIF